MGHGVSKLPGQIHKLKNKRNSAQKHIRGTPEAFPRGVAFCCCLRLERRRYFFFAAFFTAFLAGAFLAAFLVAICLFSLLTIFCCPAIVSAVEECIDLYFASVKKKKQWEWKNGQ
jgi:hypothetical protein